MPATRISGPGLSKGGPEGRRGLKGDKPTTEIDYELDRVRFEEPDGEFGTWIDIGSARRASEASAQEAEAARDEAVNVVGDAQSLVDAATAAYVGFQPGTFYDLGRVTDPLQLFPSDFGRVTDAA